MASAWSLPSVSSLWMLLLLPVPPPPSFLEQTLPGHPVSSALRTLQGTVTPTPAWPGGSVPRCFPQQQ